MLTTIAILAVILNFTVRTWRTNAALKLLLIMWTYAEAAAFLTVLFTPSVRTVLAGPAVLALIFASSVGTQ
jgi:hypothetical protein